VLKNTHVLHNHNATCYRKGSTPLETIVIGAGLSKAFGLPLAADLLPQMLGWHINRGNGHKVEPIIEFLKFFYPAFVDIAGWCPSAEDVMGMFDSAEEYSNLRAGAPGFRWREGKMAQLRMRFNSLMGQYLWAFQACMNDDTLAPLRKFVRNRGTRTAYVTFNYDLLLETALSQEAIPYSYRLDPSGQIVTLLKPHGSINWFLRSPGKMFAGKGWSTFGPNISVFDGLDPGLLPFGQRSWRQAALIAPTPHKQIAFAEMKRVWTSFSSAVHSSPTLLSIGYSMPEADRLARLVLNRASPKHGRRRITVVNPADVRAQYCQCISPDCIFVRKTFEQFV